MTRSRFIFSLVAAGLAGEALAGPVEWRMRRWSEEQQDRVARRDEEAAVTTLFFAQRLDHARGAESLTFEQEYHLDSSLASGADAPVLFYLCGEWDCTARALERGALRDHARALGAHLVALEHRYYGQSIPVERFTTESLRPLTTEAALLDAARFQRHAVAAHGLSGKWIAVGASYSANLAAYYRQRFPELVVGALASSGPVRADADFSEYDKHISEVAGAECGAAMRRVVGEMEAALAGDPERFMAIKREFAAEAVVDAVDFLYLVADVGAAAVQYGMRADFCGDLLGAAAGGELAAYGAFARRVYAIWETDAVGFSFQGMMSEDPAESPMRPWFWQSCTEYGYWQNAWPDPAVATRSQRINAAYHDEACRRMFGPGMQPVDASLLNRSFYEPLLTPAASRVLFTNGSQDPWMVLSLYPSSPDSARNAALEYVLIDGAAHCDDLNTQADDDSAALRGARAKFLELARGWLAAER
jgi:pimeloyl-ACP methyl ester carboxylesterase